MNKINKLVLIVFTIAAMITAFIANIYLDARNVGATDSCPKDYPWIKVDSDDLSQLPSSGVAEMCFKFGSVNSNGCIGGISDVWPPNVDGKYCGLSHFSYRMSTSTPTPTIDATGTPTMTLTPTVELTVSPSVTPTLTVTPTLQPTAVPTQGVNEQKWEQIRTVEGQVFGAMK